MVSKPTSSTSSSAAKKKLGTKESSTAKIVKFKLPTDFIARPHSAEFQNDKNTCVIVVNPQVLKELEISSGSLCVVSKKGFNGIVAQAQAGDDSTHPADVLLISFSLRSVSNIVLGDRLELKKITSQPAYTASVTIGNLQGIEIKDDTPKKKIEKLLTDCGIVMPGMVFRNFDVTDILKVDLVIIDANDNLLPDMSKCSVDSTSTGNTESLYLSPPSIFQKSSKVTYSNEKQVRLKYGLPQPVLYSAVGGLKKEIETLKNSINLPLHQSELFINFGISPPRGVLLHGSPGTGKTMLLRCVANDADAHVLTISGPSIVSKYLGETEAALRDVFIEAQRYQPSVIFIDEIDSLAPNRNSDDSGEVESRVVATLLTLMDGMSGSGKVVVVAATNRPNSIDPALRRPGRFDQEVEIGIPDVEARYDILTKQFEKMSSNRHNLNEDDIKEVASKTHGYVGADLSALCRESVMKAIQRGLKENLEMATLKVEIKDVMEGVTEIRPSAMKEIFLEMPKVYWSDIGGQEDLKRKLKEMIQLPLEASDTFAKLGVSAPKGVLLYGPPGCSKTLTAKALATESGVNFLAVKGPEIFNKYVGESERAIREIFRKARAAAPSIIFFDEIDALSPDRDSGSSTSSANHVLTSLLNEIDGVEELNGVVIVAATNRPDEIDPALLRPGRLDRHIYVGPPDFDARLQILRKKTAKFNIENSESILTELANKTEGCSGAEVVLLCQEAGLAAIMENTDTSQVLLKHFEKALNEISKGITPEMIEYYMEFASRSGIAA